MYNGYESEAVTQLFTPGKEFCFFYHLDASLKARATVFLRIPVATASASLPTCIRHFTAFYPHKGLSVFTCCTQLHIQKLGIPFSCGCRGHYGCIFTDIWKASHSLYRRKELTVLRLLPTGMLVATADVHVERIRQQGR